MIDTINGEEVTYPVIIPQAKRHAFLVEYLGLCHKHGLTIVSEDGYDMTEVSPLFDGSIENINYMIMEMHHETGTAATWWADQLRRPAVQDNGDAAQSSMMADLAALHKPIAREQIMYFESVLHRLLADKFKSNWYPGDPQRGSYERTVGVDYGPDEILADASERAGIAISLCRFPVKTMMWINPGEVKVAVGYGAPIKTIWKDGQSVN